LKAPAFAFPLTGSMISIDFIFLLVMNSSLQKAACSWATEIYTHVSINSIFKIKSPLDESTTEKKNYTYTTKLVVL